VDERIADGKAPEEDANGVNTL